MQTTSTQKILLALVFFGINILKFIENVGNHTRTLGTVIGRASILAMLLLAFASSFPVEQHKLPISEIPNVLNPQESVLGLAVEKGPKLVNEVPFPYVSSISAYAIDPVSKEVFVDVNSDMLLAPASTTKLLTALVSLDVYDEDEWLVVPHFCTQIEGQKSGFPAGDAFRVGDLIKSLLINSSADAACTLSVGHITYIDFMKLMNEKAEELGMEDSNFSNPVGLDGTNGEHISTAKDLYKLALSAREDETLREIVGTVQTDITSRRGMTVTLWNTNDLLSQIPGTLGIKTGRTEAAGEVLIYEYANEGKNIVIIVMGSSDRFGDTTKILNWIFQSYFWPTY